MCVHLIISRTLVYARVTLFKLSHFVNTPLHIARLSKISSHALLCSVALPFTIDLRLRSTMAKHGTILVEDSPEGSGPITIPDSPTTTTRVMAPAPSLQKLSLPVCACAKRVHSLFVVKRDRTSMERMCVRAPSYFHTCFGGRTRYGSLLTGNSFLCHIRYVE